MVYDGLVSLRLAGGRQAPLGCQSSLCFLLPAASSAGFPFGSPKTRPHEETEGIYISPLPLLSEGAMLPRVWD